MKPLTMRVRRWIAAALTLAVITLMVARLMEIQIVDAALYREAYNNRTLTTQVIKAVRGEIVDSKGNPLAANRMGYDVIIDPAFFPLKRENDKRNDIILSLIRLFQERGEEWIDGLPLTVEAPFSFLNGSDDEISRLLKTLNVAEFASAENAMYWLIDRYGLKKYSEADARAIAGIRYEMELRGFSMQTPYTFATDVDIGTVIQVKERGYEFTGVDVVESAIRYNPMGSLAPHLIGTIGPIYPEEYEALKDKGYAYNDIVGKNGAEGALEEYLRGTDGLREIYIDGENIEAIESVSPIPGNTVSLTIDSDLQRVAQESLEAQIKFLQETAEEGKGKEADAGSVFMLEVKTGKVLSAATYPSFDLSTYKQDYREISQDPLNPLFNRALNGTYEPGSTFKPTVALAGLKTGVINEFSTVLCNGRYTFYNDYQPGCLDFHGHISLTNALSLSCNIFFYDVGRRVGIEEINNVARLLGLGERTGIELAESTGQRSTPEIKLEKRGEEWFPGDTLQSSIGQFLNLYTPAQLANYAATIANRGVRMELSIVNELREYSTGRVLAPFTPTVAAKFDDITPESFEAVIKGMVAASRTGSARGTFANYPIDVAAKTGTPESTGLPNSTFICFAPADDPQVAIAVVIENGWHGYTSAPVAKALLDEYFGITDVRAPVPSGPQRLKDEREAASPGAAVNGAEG